MPILHSCWKKIGTKGKDVNKQKEEKGSKREGQVELAGAELAGTEIAWCKIDYREEKKSHVINIYAVADQTFNEKIYIGGPALSFRLLFQR
uniref:Uncharacterized protein n=1 Tax=Romanomermis culicivorax TaxID=13658 RepID=A0A915JSG4_ROMCU